MSALLALLLSSIDVTVTPDLERRTLAVTLDSQTWQGTCLCLDKPVAPALRGLSPHPEREDCYLRAETGPTRYEIDLEALRRQHDDPDFATALGPGWVLHDATFLLRADGAETDYRVRFVLPPGVSVAAPWPEPKPGQFRVSAEQFDAGSYVALGRLRALGPLQFNHFSARLTLIDGRHAATDAQLRAWVEQALRAHEQFYGGAPTRSTRPIHVVLAPVASDEAGVFGSVLRRGDPSVLLLFGDRARGGFERDWVAMHELFHLGNPPTEARYPWLTEGLTTYYTELLRARAGALPAEEAWGSLVEQLREHCAPKGRSLRDESRGLAQSHDWYRVYWSGACLALRLDVAIRQRSGQRRSLDTVVRALRLGPPLDEDAYVAAVDAEAGAPLARTQLDTTAPVPLEPLFEALGVATVRGGRAVFDDTAPLAGVRRAMTAGPRAAK